MANENCLSGMQCPVCDSYGPYVIGVETLMRFDDDGSDTYGEVIWDSDSSCSCDDCHYAGIVRNFQVREKRRYLQEGDHVEASSMGFKVTEDGAGLTDNCFMFASVLRYWHEGHKQWLDVKRDYSLHPPRLYYVDDLSGS